MAGAILSDTTILFFTDAHLGSDGSGFQQQPRRMEFLDAAMRGLHDAVHAHRVALTVCGGDFTDLGSPAEIEQAARRFHDFPGRLGVCLGNHDLAAEKSFADWRSALGASVDLADTAVDAGDCRVILLNTAWRLDGTPGWRWKPNGAPVEALFDSQLDSLDAQLGAAPDRPTIVALHGPTHALPPALTGHPTPLHVPDPTYRDTVNALLDRHPQVKLVLSGHNHVTCAERHNGRVHLSLSSIVEPPFEYALIRATPRSFRVDVLAAIPLPTAARYDPTRAWVNGRPDDRAFELAFQRYAPVGKNG